MFVGDALIGVEKKCARRRRPSQRVTSSVERVEGPIRRAWLGRQAFRHEAVIARLRTGTI